MPDVYRQPDLGSVANQRKRHLLIRICLNDLAHLIPAGYRSLPDCGNNVAVLPFENKTETEDIDKKVRESFYKHFSAKNYHDIELNEIDRTLEILLKTSSKSWRDISPRDLGSLFRADYIINGQVVDFDKYFLGVYSQISLTVAIQITRCEDAKKVWETVVTERSHDGAVPFGLIGIIPAAVRSSVHLLDEGALDLIERLNRELAAQIPDSSQPMHMAASPVFVELQVASFRDPKRAEKTRQEMEDKGFTPRIEIAMLGDRKWHRVILGPYFKFKDAEHAREKIRRDSSFKPIYLQRYPKELAQPATKAD